MTESTEWRNFDRKLVAILRGIQPHEVPDIVSGLIESGFRAIEVPLNSPDPFRSIEAAVRAGEPLTPGSCLIGAGTVLSSEDARRVKSCGGNLVVSPNVDPAVIGETVSSGMVSLPGVFTASEALLAVASGATALKFFPASILGAGGIRAIQAVLPDDTEVCAVGGVGLEDFPIYMKVGISAFGLGSVLYAPSMSADDVIHNARAVIEAYDLALARAD